MKKLLCLLIMLGLEAIRLLGDRSKSEQTLLRLLWEECLGNVAKTMGS